MTSTQASARPRCESLAGPGRARRGRRLRPSSGAVNMHCHTFFSYNAYGHSPSSLAWLAKKNGYAAIGIVDFDVLDAVDEFLDACELLRRAGQRGHRDAGVHPGVRHARDQLARRAGRVLPHGHRVHVGPRAGRRSRRSSRRCASAPARRNRDDARPAQRSPGARSRSTTRPTCCRSRRRATPPSGTCSPPTSRRGERRFPDAAGPRRASGPASWACRRTQVAAAIGDYAKFSNLVRGKLMKQGGVGYVKPSPEAFPTVEEFHSFITGVRRAAVRGVARRDERGRAGHRRTAGPAHGQRRGRAQHHPRPQLEHRGLRSCAPEGAQAERNRPDSPASSTCR